MIRHSRTLICFALLLLVLLTGCERRETANVSPFQQEPCDYVLTIAIDLSDGFREYMTADGKAYDLVLRAIEKYFRDRIGGHDQIIITQLSGNKRPILWQGTPQQLQREFPDSNAFREYVLAHATPHGCRLNDGIADSIDYTLRMNSVARGNAKSALMILSKMLDDQPEQVSSDARLMKALTTYAHRGYIGFYFVDQLRMADITEKLEKAGFTMHTLECDFHGRPPVPSFE